MVMKTISRTVNRIIRMMILPHFITNNKDDISQRSQNNKNNKDNLSYNAQNNKDDENKRFIHLIIVL